LAGGFGLERGAQAFHDIEIDRRIVTRSAGTRDAARPARLSS
jgi:hypothetical protein